MFINHSKRIAIAVFALLAASSTLSAQKLHVNNRWDECAIVIAPSLTQGAWHQFVDEVALVAYLRPMDAAKPLGRGRYEFAILNAATNIDDADAAWNDTFSHPDSTHWLFEGDALKIPGLMARYGVSDRLDVAAYFTKAFGANYGIASGQVQYNLFNDSARQLAMAVRLNGTRLFGPDDMTVSVYGIDFVASKTISRFSPYAGVSGYLSRGHERTSKVNLEDESIFGVQANVGVAARVSALRLGAEINLAKVPGYSVKVGFGT
jgi:hypothetical protein